MGDEGERSEDYTIINIDSDKQIVEAVRIARERSRTDRRAVIISGERWEQICNLGAGYRIALVKLAEANRLIRVLRQGIRPGKN
jgi:hypothetical protein